jgi:hypothetical protein
MGSAMLSFLTIHLRAVAIGFLIVNGIVLFFAERSLFNNLKRYEPSQWLTLGSPEKFKITRRQFTGVNGILDEWRIGQYILSLKYLSSERSEIRSAGHIAFGCSIVSGLLGIYLIFGH